MERKRTLRFRELAGFFLLTVLLAGGLLSSRALDRQHRAMASALEDSAVLALSGRWQAARDRAESACQDWQADWPLRAVFSDHSPMKEIDSLFGELAVYGAAGDRTEFARICGALSLRLDGQCPPPQLVECAVTDRLR